MLATGSLPCVIYSGLPLLQYGFISSLPDITNHHVNVNGNQPRHDEEGHTYHKVRVIYKACQNLTYGMHIEFILQILYTHEPDSAVPRVRVQCPHLCFTLLSSRCFSPEWNTTYMHCKRAKLVMELCQWHCSCLTDLAVRRLSLQLGPVFDQA